MRIQIRSNVLIHSFIFSHFYSPVLRFGGRGRNNIQIRSTKPTTWFTTVAHLCFITYMYITLQCKASDEKNYYFHIGDDFRGHAYLEIPLSQRKKNDWARSGRMRWWPIFFKKKKRNRLVYQQKPHQTRDKRQTHSTYKHLLTPYKKNPNSHTQHSAQTVLTTLHIYQKCALVIWFKKDK